MCAHQNVKQINMYRSLYILSQFSPVFSINDTCILIHKRLNILINAGYTLSVRSLGTAALPRSLPLVLSEEIQYNPQTHTVVQVPSEQTGSKLVVVQSTLNLIRSLGTKPLAVLSICGPYRSGKSYFLSRFLGSDEVFKISNTDDPCTQGIWMSTSILECEEFAILLLDTEGMGSLEASEDYIVKLLVVTIISSSVLIYNSIGIPQRCDLENLR